MGGVLEVCGECYITLGKLIGLLFLSCLPLDPLYLFLKTKRNDLARPVMGTIFLVIFIIFLWLQRSIGQPKVSFFINSKKS